MGARMAAGTAGDDMAPGGDLHHLAAVDRLDADHNSVPADAGRDVGRCGVVLVDGPTAGDGCIWRDGAADFYVCAVHALRADRASPAVSGSCCGAHCCERGFTNAPV